MVEAHIERQGAVRLVVTPDSEPGLPPVLQMADRHALTVRRLTLDDVDWHYRKPERAARIPKR